MGVCYIHMHFIHVITDEKTVILFQVSEKYE